MQELEKGKKQGRIRREWDLPGDGTLQVIEQTSFDLDKVRVLASLAFAYTEVRAEDLGFRTCVELLAMATPCRRTARRVFGAEPTPLDAPDL